MSDLRTAVRALAMSPLFTEVVAATLAGQRTRRIRLSGLVVALVTLVPRLAAGQGLPGTLEAEIHRGSKVLDSLPDSGLAKSETPAMKERLHQAGSLLKAGHVAAALESLSSPRAR